LRKGGELFVSIDNFFASRNRFHPWKLPWSCRLVTTNKHPVLGCAFGQLIHR
jgi:hypothetical protein